MVRPLIQLLTHTFLFDFGGQKLDNYFDLFMLALFANIRLFVLQVENYSIRTKWVFVSPLILWIELGGKPTWLPLKSGYHDVMRTPPKSTKTHTLISHPRRSDLFSLNAKQQTQRLKLQVQASRRLSLLVGDFWETGVWRKHLRLLTRHLDQGEQRCTNKKKKEKKEEETVCLFSHEETELPTCHVMVSMALTNQWHLRKGWKTPYAPDGEWKEFPARLKEGRKSVPALF